MGILDHCIIFTDPSGALSLKELNFLFDKDGSIRLMATTEKSSHAAFERYLLPFGVDSADLNFCSYVHVTGREVKRAWEAFKRHNTFHKETAKYIDTVLKKGNWKKVP